MPRVPTAPLNHLGRVLLEVATACVDYGSYVDSVHKQSVANVYAMMQRTRAHLTEPEAHSSPDFCGETLRRTVAKTVCWYSFLHACRVGEAKKPGPPGDESSPDDDLHIVTQNIGGFLGNASATTKTGAQIYAWQEMNVPPELVQVAQDRAKELGYQIHLGTHG